MPGVAVVTDSTNYLPRPITEHFAIREVSLYVTVNGVQHRETEMDSIRSVLPRAGRHA